MVEPIDGSLIEPQEVKETDLKFDPTAVYLYNASENDDPEYVDEGSSGMDLRAELSKINEGYLFDAFLVQNKLIIHPGGRALIPTGLHMALPLGLEGQIRPRSGLALKYGITVLNSPGTIDSSYRGDIGVILKNDGKTPFEVKTGDRIAQLVIIPYAKILRFAKVNNINELPTSERMCGGFGSTGVE